MSPPGNTFLRPLDNIRCLYNRFAQEEEYQGSLSSPRTFDATQRSFQYLSPTVRTVHPNGTALSAEEHTATLADDVREFTQIRQTIQDHMESSLLDSDGYLNAPFEPKDDDALLYGQLHYPSSYSLPIESMSSLNESILSQDSSTAISNMQDSAELSRSEETQTNLSNTLQQQAEVRPPLKRAFAYNGKEDGPGTTEAVSCLEGNDTQMDAVSPVLEKRAEQNRRKSRKYYHKKKEQRLITHNVVSVFRQTLEHLRDEGYSATKSWMQAHTALTTTSQAVSYSVQGWVEASIPDLFQETSPTPGLRSPSTPMKAKMERNKALWRMQKDLDHQIFRRLSSIAVLLSDFSANLLARKDHGTDADTYVQQRLVASWLDLRFSWNELEMVEARQCREEDDTPIAHLILQYRQSEYPFDSPTKTAHQTSSWVASQSNTPWCSASSS